MTNYEAPEAVKRYRPLAELVSGDWHEDTVVANGIRQHYWRTSGDGRPLVLLHGMLGSGLTWLRVARALEDDFDVVMPDARGHGGTELGEGFTLTAVFEDVVGLLDALALERPALIGHSLGGMTAALVAADYPDHVSTIALEDAVWGDGPGLSEIAVQSEGYQRWLAGFIECVEQLPTLSHVERMVAAFPYLAPGADAWPEDVYVPWVEAQAQLDMGMLRQGSALWAMAPPPRSLRRLVEDIRCPILLMTGGRSNTDPQMIEQVAEAWREGQHIRFADAGHLIQVDAFEEYVGAVRAFLK